MSIQGWKAIPHLVEKQRVGSETLTAKKKKKHELALLQQQTILTIQWLTPQTFFLTLLKYGQQVK